MYVSFSFALDFPPNDAIDWRFLEQKTIEQRKEMQFSRNNKQSFISWTFLYFRVCIVFYLVDKIV